MKIQFLGHSCFLLVSDGGTRIVTDPYGDVGFPLPPVSADAVTVSHGHYDHCNVAAVGGHPNVFDAAGSFAVGDVAFSAVRSFHDGAEGRLRGKNLIFAFRFGGLRAVHLGDLGEACSERRLATIAEADVLFIPVGGVYTIDAPAAKEYVERLRPSYVIPMHYAEEGLNIRLGTVEKFTDLFRGEKGYTVEKIGSTAEILPVTRGTTKILIMEREQA